MYRLATSWRFASTFAAENTMGDIIRMSMRRLMLSGNSERSEVGKGLLLHSSKHNSRQRNKHHNHKFRKEASMMTFHSDNRFFPESKPTGWAQRNFPNQSNRLPNRVWRKQSK